MARTQQMLAHSPSAAGVLAGIALALVVVRAVPPPVRQQPSLHGVPGAGVVLVGPLGLRTPAQPK